MFSFILVVSTGYILLISVSPMLKAGKMKSLAAVLHLQIYLKITLMVSEFSAFDTVSRF